MANKKRPNTDFVKERLEDYLAADRDIELQEQRLDRIEMKLKSIGSPSYSGMPKDPSPSQSRMADLVCQKIDLENEIKQMIAKQKKERTELEKIIKRLRHANERAVIRMRYFDGMRWNDVLDVLFGDRPDFFYKEESYERTMYNIHGSALANMARYIEATKKDDT